MMIYNYKCKQCEAEYYYRTDIPYTGEKIKCPECSGTDCEITEYNPQADNYAGWDTCTSGSFG